MGHDTVKAALTAALTDRLAGYGQPSVWVIPGDELPVDNDRWPLALVRTTRMTTTKASGGPVLRCTYRCRVTVGVRCDDGETDVAFAAASDGRDQLLQAVRNALLHNRGLGDGVRVSPSGLVEDTEPVIATRQGPREAYGQISFDVTAMETVTAPTTDPADPVITDAQVEIHAHPADHPLYEGAPQ